MPNCFDLCEAALKSFLAKDEPAAVWDSPYSPQYTREMMLRAIRRAGKGQTIGCTVKEGKVTLFRKGVRSMKLESAEPPKQNEARNTLNSFMASGYRRALVDGGRNEYQALYRLCGYGKYKHVRVHMEVGKVFLNLEDENGW